MTEDEIIAEATRRTRKDCPLGFTPNTAKVIFARHYHALKTNPVDERTRRARELFEVTYPDWSFINADDVDRAHYYRLVDAGCVIVTDEMLGSYENIRRAFENCESLLLLDIQRLAPLFAKVKP